MSERSGSHLRLYILISLMTLAWAGNFIVTKVTIREFPPVLAAGLRMMIAGALMVPVYVWYTRKTGKGYVSRRDLWQLVTIGLLGVGLNQMFFVFGMARTSVAHAAIIIGLTPVTVLLLAAAMGQERLSAARLAGMFVALAGVGVLQWAGEPNGQKGTLLGDFIVFCGSFTFAVFTVKGKAEAHRLGSVAVNSFAYVSSAIVVTPITLWASHGFRFADVTWIGWAGLLYMAVFASVLCYLVYYYALEHIPASRVSAFSYLQPVIATLLAIPLLHEYPTVGLVAGGALVLTGVVVAERF